MLRPPITLAPRELLIGPTPRGPQAFLSLIAERQALGGYVDFEAFAAASPDLMDASVLKRWYAPERLMSGIARKTFVLPDAGR